MLIPITYAKIKDKVRTGDIIACGGGEDLLSKAIEKVTKGNITHVAGVLETHAMGTSGISYNLGIESTMRGSFLGVQIASLDLIICEKEFPEKGERRPVWYLPLKDEIFRNFDCDKYSKFLKSQIGKSWDYRQAFYKVIGRKIYEDFNSFFCSEIVAAGLEAGGAVTNINVSEITPIDICKWNIWKEDYYLLVGDPEVDVIEGYNTKKPV
jgi:hypothetical protein